MPTSTALSQRFSSTPATPSSSITRSITSRACCSSRRPASSGWPWRTSTTAFPRGHAFILDGFDVAFDRYAELDEDVLIVGTTRDRVERRGTLSSMTFEGCFQQGEVELGRMTGRWRMVSGALLRRLRRRR